MRVMKRKICGFGGYLVWPVAAVIFAAGCGTGKAHIQAAKQVQRDFYTCKGFQGGRPVAATSEFSVSDGLVYVVAELEKEQVGSRLDFEITAPTGKIAYYESVKYAQKRPYGIYFDTRKLLERGGPGRWKALFWADGQPMGRLFFNVEGPPEMAKEWGRTPVASPNLFDRMFGEEARPAGIPAAVTEEPSEEAIPLTETPEGMSLAPGEELITPESKPAVELEKPSKEIEEAVEEESP